MATIGVDGRMKPEFTIERYLRLCEWAKRRIGKVDENGKLTYATWHGANVVPERDRAAHPKPGRNGMFPSFYTRIEEAAWARFKADDDRRAA